MNRRTFVTYSLAGFAAPLLNSITAACADWSEVVLSRYRLDRCKTSLRPCVVGLGPWGARAAQSLSLALPWAHGASIYADTHVSGSAEVNCLVSLTPARVLEGSRSSVLVFAADDSAACSSALHWAQCLCEEDTYFKAAIVCTPEALPQAMRYRGTFIQDLQTALDVVVLQPDGGSTLSTLQSTVRSVRLFLMEPGFICHSLSDLKDIFPSKRIAAATTTWAIPSARGGDPGDAVDAGLRHLGTFSVDGAFARWNGGPEMSMADFDQLWTRLEERLPGTASGGVIDGSPDDLAPNEPGWLHAIWSFRGSP